eukprot:jgi/Botrbrau1/11137/Bobra.331_1s0007.1
MFPPSNGFGPLTLKTPMHGLMMVALCIVIWILWEIIMTLSAWVTVELRLQRSGIPKGPSSSETFAGFSNKQIHRFMTRWMEKFGSVFWYRLGPYHIVQITDPTLVAEILHGAHPVDKPAKLSQALVKPLSDKGYHNLLSSATNAQWRLIRKAVMPVFSFGSLKRLFPAVQGTLARLDACLRSVRPDKPLNMTDILTCLAMDVIGIVGFDTDMNGLARVEHGGSLEADKVAITLDMITECQKLLVDPLREFKVWQPDVRKGKVALARFHRVTRDLLHHLKEKDRSGRLDPDTVAGRLLRIKDPTSGAPLSDDVLVPQIGIFFAAGFETTAHTLAWVLYCLSQHREVEAKLVDELAALGLLASSGNPKPRQVEWEDLPKLVYLEAVIKEALRFYTVAGIGTTREACANIVLGGRYNIPKGTIMWIPLFPFMRSRANWEGADVFCPERFLQEGAEVALQIPASPLSTSSGSSAWPEGSSVTKGERLVKRYLPFSEGPRSCAGMPLAKITLSATLATLMSRYSFTLAPEMGGPEGVRRRESSHITLGVDGGLKFLCQPRVPFN